MAAAETLTGRHVLLALSGGVAAYKSAYLARRLVERGAVVKVIMTEAATMFVGPQTLAAIVGSQPELGLFARDRVSPHTELARWADVVVVAPATAATMARIAGGLSEDVLSATVLAAVVPVVIAPAMHTEMWEHPATQRNVAQLVADGYHLVGPATGALAGGDEGVGRLVEPDVILADIERMLGPRDLEGLTIVVSAGGTREAIDPVRFIGNRSSGKMGNAIALVAARRGGQVTLVTSAPAASHGGVDVVLVETAQQMADAVWGHAAKADVAVMAAAVADFRPADPPATKLRRSEGSPDIVLEPTPDILAGIAAMESRPYLVGFAAETGSMEEAIAKAKRKGVDVLVGNDVSKQGSGFGSDTNEVTIIRPDGSTEPWALMSKVEVAERLWDLVAADLAARSGGATS